jgi:hypothetical protein
MNKPRLIAVVLVLFCLAMVTFSVQAGQSTNYRLDWFTPLTSGGGGAASSAHYAANVTLGQTASKASESANFQAGLGFWSGVLQNILIHMPFLSR